MANPIAYLVEVEIPRGDDDSIVIDVVGSNATIEVEDVEPYIDFHVLPNDKVIVNSLDVHCIDLINPHASHDNTLDELLDLHLPSNFAYIECSDCTNGSCSICIEIVVVTSVDDVEPTIDLHVPPSDEVEKHDIIEVGGLVNGGTDIELHPISGN
ncbi:hypothetical protein RJT34_05735 [Clitoria ternatea]|uniref:Uncharacterized protein n=1 Tax=Clitoria ternatea TaxID=43366 RepID=A0AAN9K3E5_CLITE